jgi:hypothetical protein
VELLTRETIRAFTQGHEPPCISLYQPTHRHHPDNQQDPIRFKNLMGTIEESLRRKYKGREIRPLLAPFEKLASDGMFWNHTLDGLAVLATSESFRVFQLQRPVRALAVVADSFHVKPLLRVVQSADRYDVLCLTRQSARVLEGNRYALDPLDLSGFPATMTAALGEQLTEPTRGMHSTGTPGGTVQHGHGSRKDEIDKDAERYFRVVDRAVLEQVSKRSDLPLILVALAEHQPVFRGVSQNPSLAAKGVEVNPESLTNEELRAAAWRVVEPRYAERLAKLSEAYRTAAARQKGTSDLSDAARAAVEGRIATLLVDADRVIPGRIDPGSGAVAKANLEEPDIDDALDDLAELVLRTGGEVVVVPSDRMPTPSGLAATFRY